MAVCSLKWKCSRKLNIAEFSMLNDSVTLHSAQAQFPPLASSHHAWHEFLQQYGNTPCPLLSSPYLLGTMYTNGDALLAGLTAFVSCDWVDQ